MKSKNIKKYQNLFVSKIFHDSLNIPNRKKFLSELTDEVYKFRAMDDAGVRWSKANYPNGYTSYGSYANLHLISSSFSFLAKKIDGEVFRFLRRLDYDVKKSQLYMSSFWINIMGQNCTHSWHIHPRSVVSGTFYISLPVGAKGIEFMDPRMELNMMGLLKRASAKTENQSVVRLRPRAGDLVLFESWMRHQVPLNLGAGDRISVSFNYSVQF